MNKMGKLMIMGMGMRGLSPRLFTRAHLYTTPFTSTSLKYSPTNWARKYSTTSDKPLVRVKFIVKDGSEKEFLEPSGSSILEIAHKHDIDLEGACEASLACSTCHVWVDPSYYKLLPEPTDEENDMLDLAFELRDNSRLGCQIRLTPELDGITVKLPPATRNMAVDGYKPPKH